MQLKDTIQLNWGKLYTYNLSTTRQTTVYDTEVGLFSGLLACTMQMSMSTVHTNKLDDDTELHLPSQSVYIHSCHFSDMWCDGIHIKRDDLIDNRRPRLPASSISPSLDPFKVCSLLQCAPNRGNYTATAMYRGYRVYVVNSSIRFYAFYLCFCFWTVNFRNF